MSKAPFDASIPVLTEVLQPELAGQRLPAEPANDKLLETAQEQLTATAHEQPPAPAALPPSENTAELEASAIAQWGDADWAQLEQHLAERILHKLQARVDFVLEQRIKDSMAEVLNHALQGLTHDIRSGLHDTLEKIVSRAVSQELLHLQAQKK